jgi:hypothetical protein
MVPRRREIQRKRLGVRRNLGAPESFNCGAGRWRGGWDRDGGGGSFSDHAEGLVHAVFGARGFTVGETAHGADGERGKKEFVVDSMFG